MIAKRPVPPKHNPILYPCHPLESIYTTIAPKHLLQMASQLGKLALELHNLGINKVFQLMSNVDFLHPVGGFAGTAFVDNFGEIGDPSTVPCEELVPN